MKVKLGASYLLGLISGAVLIWFSIPVSHSKLDMGKLEAGAHAAARALVSLTEPNGRFVYQVNARTDKQLARYNIIRHAGAIYSLAMYDERYPSQAVKDTIVKAVGFMISSSMAPVSGEGFQGRTFLNDPFLKERAGEKSLALLGGAGLGLIALTSAERVVKGTVSEDVMRDVARFILFLQKPTGEFFNRFDLKTGRRDNELVSLYYPGEAILGLVMLYKLDHNPEWLAGAVKGLRFLAVSRVGKYTVPADNWALIATELLMTIESLSNEDRELFIKHASQISAANRATQVLDPESLAFGAYTPSGKVTHTTTRLEGLQAVLPLLSIPERSEIKTSVDLALGFVLKSQIKSGRYAGAIPDAPFGSVLRIDFTQHALSAMLRRLSADQNRSRRGTDTSHD
jgi:hypothetical protein